jgi:CBS domain-containing protein
VDHAAQLMKDEDVGPIPVVADQETKRLPGIGSDRDLAVKVVAEARSYSVSQGRRSDVPRSGELPWRG